MSNRRRHQFLPSRSCLHGETVAFPFAVPRRLKQGLQAERLKSMRNTRVHVQSKGCGADFMPVSGPLRGASVSHTAALNSGSVPSSSLFHFAITDVVLLVFSVRSHLSTAYPARALSYASTLRSYASNRKSRHAECSRIVQR